MFNTIQEYKKAKEKLYVFDKDKLAGDYGKGYLKALQDCENLILNVKNLAL